MMRVLISYQPRRALVEWQWQLWQIACSIVRMRSAQVKSGSRCRACLQQSRKTRTTAVAVAAVAAAAAVAAVAVTVAAAVAAAAAAEVPVQSASAKRVMRIVKPTCTTQPRAAKP
eukprot:537953-Amphidinium_carterae.2